MVLKRVLFVIKRFKHLLNYKKQFEFKKLYFLKKIKKKSNHKIIFWIPGGMSGMLEVEGAIAAALKLRGHKVHCIICDGPFKACVRREITIDANIKTWHKLCNKCRKECEFLLKYFGIEYSFIGDYISKNNNIMLKEQAKKVLWENLSDYTFDNIFLGKSIKNSIIRYYQGLNYNDNKTLLFEYAFSALITLFSSNNVIAKFKPDKIFMSHAAYVDWGPALNNALKKNIPVFCWSSSYLHSRFYFFTVNEERKLRHLSDNSWNIIKNKALKLKEQEQLKDYFEERYIKGNSFDIIEFKQFSSNIASKFKQKYNINNKNKTWVIFAHLNFEEILSVLYDNSCIKWIFDTISIITNITDVNWLIKIHPAEKWYNTVTGTCASILKKFPNMPKHIKIIPADENINPYNFYELVDGGITVSGTPGLELSYFCKPVILVGEAYYGGKGFTIDVKTKKEYYELLKNASQIQPLKLYQKELVDRYLYTYLIRCQIPFPPVYNPNGKWWKYDHSKRHLLLPGRDKYVDFICDRILDGKEFIMPDELLDFEDNI